nr:MAG TPA: hypothetical protein [Caudoviricetes sp.]
MTIWVFFAVAIFSVFVLLHYLYRTCFLEGVYQFHLALVAVEVNKVVGNALLKVAKLHHDCRTLRLARLAVPLADISRLETSLLARLYIFVVRSSTHTHIHKAQIVVELESHRHLASFSGFDDPSGKRFCTLASRIPLTHLLALLIDDSISVIHLLGIDTLCHGVHLKLIDGLLKKTSRHPIEGEYRIFDWFTHIAYIIKRLGFFRHDILAVTATREVVERLQTLPVHAHHEPLSGVDVAHHAEGDGTGVDALQLCHHHGIIGKAALGDGAAACALHLKKPGYEVLAVVGEVVGRAFYLIAVVTTKGLRRVLHLGEKPHLVRDRYLLCVNEFAGGQYAV